MAKYHFSPAVIISCVMDTEIQLKFGHSSCFGWHYRLTVCPDNTFTCNTVPQYHWHSHPLVASRDRTVSQCSALRPQQPWFESGSRGLVLHFQLWWTPTAANVEVGVNSAVLNSLSVTLTVEFCRCEWECGWLFVSKRPCDGDV